jgi:glycosyltransferase involved in cell wall biosynthesis
MKRRVALIIHSLGIGGMERVMSQLANHFADKIEDDIHIILIGKKREVMYHISESVQIYKPNFDFRNQRRIIDTVRTIVFLRYTVKKINPDVILSFGEIWNNLVLIALKGVKVPIFISDRSQPGKDLGNIHNYLRKKLYPGAAGYIAQTRKAKRICINMGWNKNVKVIGNPIHKVAPNNNFQKENIVLSVGRLIKTKHFDQLIKMFVEVAPLGWKLIVVGGDAKKQNGLEELQNLVKELGADEQVFLEGKQKNIDYYYQKSKIFAFTSSSEGFPNVIGEALSSGLPVVSYDCIAGPSDMIEDRKNGFLVPLFDQEKFKKRLSELMENEELRKKISDKAGASITRFNENRIGNQFYQFMMTANPTISNTISKSDENYN